MVYTYLETRARARQAKKFSKKLVDVVKLQPSFVGITVDINALFKSDDG
jgi:hypothetical protein